MRVSYNGTRINFDGGGTGKFTFKAAESFVSLFVSRVMEKQGKSGEMGQSGWELGALKDQ